MKFHELVYISKAAAIGYGFTHEGWMFGMPAYLRDDGDDMVIACPKVGILQFLNLFLDSLMQFAAYFIPEDAVLVTPITFGEPLQ
jgi:hypothetical protein